MDDASSKVELPRREIAILPREVAVKGKSQLRLVTGRRILIRIRQPGSVAVNRAGHPELPGAARHLLGKSRLAVGQSLGQHRGGIVRRPGDEPQNEFLHCDRFAGSESQFCRRATRGLVGDREILVRPKPADIQRFEDQIERHHFGERGRIGDRIGVHRAQNASGFDIDHDRFAHQSEAGPRRCVAGLAMRALPPRFCLARGK